MNFVAAARKYVFNRKAATAATVGIGLLNGACSFMGGDNLSALGFQGMDPSLDNRFKPVCHSVNPLVVIYDNARGDRFRVHLTNNEVYASGESNTQGNPGIGGGWRVYTRANYQSPITPGSTLVGPNTALGIQFPLSTIERDGTVRADTPDQRAEGIRHAIQKAISDVFYAGILPGRPCEALARAGANDPILFPSN